jgi:hypothetical protein
LPEFKWVVFAAGLTVHASKKVDRKSFLKRVAGMAAGVGLAVAVGLELFKKNSDVGSTAASGTVNGVDVSTLPVAQEASYIIEQISSKYYARPAPNSGLTAYSGADAATVINSAIAALTNGGRIAVKKGTYTLSSLVTDQGNDNIILEGEGWGTIFTVSDGFAHSPIFIAPARKNWTLRDFQVDGTNLAVAGSYCNVDVRSSSTLLQNILSVNCADHGGFWIQGSKNRVICCHAYNNKDDGFIFQQVSYTLVEGCISDTTTLRNCYSMVSCDHMVLNGNIAMNATAGAGFAFENLGSGVCHDIVISNNMIRTTGSDGIRVYAASGGVEAGDDILIIGNEIDAVHGNGVTLLSGKRITIRSNIINCEGITTNAVRVDSDAVGPFSEIEVSGNTVLTPLQEGIYLGFHGAAATRVKVDQNTIFPKQGVSFYGIYLQSVFGFTCNSNRIVGSGALGTNEYGGGIFVDGDTINSVGGTIANNAIVGGATYGIRLCDGTTDITVEGNYIEQVTKGLAESKVSVSPDSVDPDYNVWRNNNVRNSVTTPVTKLGVHSLWVGNLGYNPQALAAISVTASPFTYTNTDGYPEEVTVTGGTVSDISLVRGGVTTSLGLTTGIFLLEVGDGLQVTYTGAPTMEKIPH